MALITCKECAAKVSDKAASCPQCGAARPKKTGMATWFVGGLFAFVVGSLVIKGQHETATASPAAPTAIVTAAPAAPTQADLEINVAIAAARAIKAGTKNPASFKLEAFLIYPGGATCYEYRGTNSFNAVVPGKAVFDPHKPLILTSDRDGNKFVKAWNDICTKPGAQERHRGVLALTDI